MRVLIVEARAGYGGQNAQGRAWLLFWPSVNPAKEQAAMKHEKHKGMKPPKGMGMEKSKPKHKKNKKH